MLLLSHQMQRRNRTAHRGKRKTDVMQKSIRVLIADDQPRARNSLRALLSTWSQVSEVCEASNGREAVQLVNEFRPDVVLMDVRMPELDGLQATVQIKATWPAVKVILLSMYSEHQDQARIAGADAFVGKGEAADRLLSLLSAFVQRGAQDG
jgi:DNA-binding NarL/FixJ family response regulator